MKNVELSTFPSPDELARTAAELWLNDVVQSGRDGRPMLVALSGGRITKTFFSETVSQAKAREVAMEAVHFFWADERCVPPNDPESNYRMAKDLLFEPLSISETQVHRIQGELDPDEAVSQASDEIRRMAAMSINHQPVLDIVFLGMGEDGHVASLFPGETEEELYNPAFFRSVVAVKPPPQRVTLGFQAIVAAREVWVLASGNGKRDALKASLASDGTTPLARVLRERRTTRIFTDVPLD